MAGLTITVGGNDITAYVDVRSLVIEEVGTEIVARCSFKVRDHSGTVSIVTKDTIDVDDDGTTIFAGEVATLEMEQEGVAKAWSLRGQDYNILLEETTIESESYEAGVADSAIIADLFTDYRSDIDGSTYVATLDASMETVAFAGMTLREILDDLARRTGARYYVDYDKNLHWFSAESNDASFGLSTSPDGVTTYPFGGFRKVEDATRIADKVFVLGKGISGWYPAGTPDYDGTTRHAVSRDQRISTAQGVTDRGTAIYNRFATARETYELWTEKDGLRAGQSVAVTNATWGISAQSFYIRRISTEILATSGDTRRYHLQLNDEAPDPARSARQNSLIIATIETVVNSVSDTVFDTDAPSAPDALGVANITTGVSLDADGHQIVYVEVTWSEVSDSDLDHYQIQLSTQSDFTSDIISRNHPAGGSRHERFAGLLGNTTYYVRVRATDWVGNDSAWDYGEESAYSFTSSKDSSAPSQVANLSAAASRTLIGLSWDNNSEADLAYYEIQRDTDSEGAPAGSWATIAHAYLSFYIDQDFSDEEIAGEDTFWYRVRAVDTSANKGDWATQTSAQLTQIAADHLAAGCITTAKLFAGAVTAEKITVAQLSAIAADLGTITAGTVTGATIRTAASGARVVLDSTDGLQCYNSGETLCAQIDVDGSGQIGASGGAVPPLTWNALGQFNRLQANQLQIGQQCFNSADGLLLLGPHCYISPTAWRSLRGQVATLSGAFHQVQGMWLETRGLVVEEATTNLITNPSIETNADGWLPSVGTETITQSADYALFGDYSLKIITAIAGAGEAGAYRTVTTQTAASTQYTFSVWLRGEGTVRLWVYDVGAGSQYSSSITLTSTWTRYTLTFTYGAGAARYVGILNVNTATEAITFYADGAQLEAKAYPTSYCDGAQGTGYTWTGAAHASTSTRAATEVNLDAYSGLVSGNNTLSVRVVAQAPFASTEDWSTNNAPILWTAFGAGVDIIQLYFTGGDLLLYIGGTTCVQTAVTFAQGDWLDVVATIDFTNDAYKVYLNGELLDTDTTVLAPFATTAMNVGAYTDGQYWWDGPIAEFAIFDKVLTAAEVAQLYNLQRPLIDAGAMETPGIYIYDGKFRISSSSTGNRIEMTADEIAGYDSAGTKQFYLQASDGKAMAGAGAVTLDESGIRIACGTGTANYIQFRDGSVTRGYVYQNVTGDHPSLYVFSGPANAANKYSDLHLVAYPHTGSATSIILQSEYTGVDGYMVASIDGAARLYIKDHGIKVGGDIRLTDGVLPPTHEAGYAILYIDSEDGDLKIKFGDGFIRTIATDS